MDEKRMITLRLSEQEISEIDTLAKMYEVNRSELIRRLVERELVDQANYYEFMSAKSSSDRIDEAIHNLKFGVLA